MDLGLLQTLAFGIIAGAANVIGGLILFPTGLAGKYRPYLKYLLALGAGFMLAVTFFEIIPKTILIWQRSDAGPAESLSLPMILLLGGYLLTQFFQHTVASHFHLGEEVVHEELITTSAAYSAVSGLLVHTFFDGVAIAAATQIDLRAGFLVFIAVLIHKLPEGFTVGSVILASGRGRSAVLTSTSLIGLMTVVGVLLYYIIGQNFGLLAGYALPIASGVTLYVAATDLVPEVNHHGGGKAMVSISLFSGVALFFLLHLGLESVLGH